MVKKNKGMRNSLEILSVIIIVATLLWVLIWASSVIFGNTRDYLSEKREKHIQERLDYKNPIDVCIEQGGIPIKSIWNNGLKDCQFKND